LILHGHTTPSRGHATPITQARIPRRMTRTIRVHLGPRSYDVIVGAGVLSELGTRLRAVVDAGRVLVVSDDVLPPALTSQAGESLTAAGLQVSWASVHASERDKSMATAQRITEAAAAARLERGDAIVALGGGVVGDLAGFAASIYRRGVACIQCPTTLLAMVDASVGGKTAVNLVVPASAGAPDSPRGGGTRQEAATGERLLKNMAGTFHQPRLVLADVRALATLPHPHLRAGLAECIKHAMLGMDFGDGTMLPLLEKDGPAIAAGRGLEGALVKLVARNIAIKADVVAKDEFEQSLIERGRGREPSNAGRESLNLGHTFGHALEAMAWLTPDGDRANAPLQHGEAVALGCIAAAATAEALNQVPAGLTETIRRVVASVGLPTRIAGLPDDDAIIAAMMDDKKVRGGTLRLVLPWLELGRVRIAENPDPAAVKHGLAAIRAG
jgi:3-dehydroquinate synthase